MRIIRLGLFIALVVLLFPTNKEEQARVYDRVASAASWTATFCDRNVATCDRAGDLWSALIENAQYGVQMAYEHALNYARGDDRAMAPRRPHPSRGTLTPQDLQPTWRGASNRTGA